MSKVTLVCALNAISRHAGHAIQRLGFMVRVANVAFEKHVDVLWTGEDGQWHETAARFDSDAPDDEEFWVAEIRLPQTPERSLPGNIVFAVRYRVLDEEHWDSNEGRNHAIEADSGVRLLHDTPLISRSSRNRMADGNSQLAVAAAVDARLDPQGVNVHWSTDDWLTTRTTACRLRRDFWNAAFRSNARNPNQYGVQIWDAQLDLQRWPSVKYRVACESAQQTMWDDYSTRKHSLPSAPLRVLVLNLHCYQEADQAHKLWLIAHAIDELGIDVACFQEVAENWNDGNGDWGSNSARIINGHLRRPFHLATDWSHLGFDRYREGVAVLSRYPILRQDARYVSTNRDPYSIHSRKVVLAQIGVPAFGRVNVFSSHLSWWEDGFGEQFAHLRRWARDAQTRHVEATLLCGDFNIEAGSRGYEFVLDSGEYDDTFLAATRPRAFADIFRNRAANWRDRLGNDRRIDYIFMRRTSRLRAVAAREVFTERDFGRVSDHIGYMVSFAAK